MLSKDRNGTGAGPFAQRGAYISWLHWYGAVMEPVLVLEALGLSQPSLACTFRGMAELTAKLSKALQNGPYLLGDSYCAADLLVQSPYAWFKDATPEDPAIRDWVTRCTARPSVVRTKAADAALMDTIQFAEV